MPASAEPVAVSRPAATPAETEPVSNRAASPADDWRADVGRILGLMGGAFLMAVAFGVVRVGQPESLKSMGGDDSASGVFGGAVQAGYLAGLFLLWPAASPLGVRTTATGAAAVLAIFFLSEAAVAERWAFLAIGAVQGAVTSLLWPSIMGWVASGVEGDALGRRLGRYNLSWSTGLVVGPVIGGALCGWVGVSSAMYAAAACSVAAVVALSAMRPPESAPATAPGPDAKEPPAPAAPPPDAAAHFHAWSARLANLSIYVASGVTAWQFPALGRLLNVDPFVYGLIQTCSTAATAAGFAALGRSDFWRGNFGWLAGVQAVGIATLLSLWFAESAAHMAVAAAVVGLCQAATYSSAVFHGAAVAKRRGDAMAVHEIVLSVGYIIGSVGGGRLSEAAPRLWPGADLRMTYPAGAALMAVLLAAFLALQLVRPRTAAATATDGVRP
jgi:MFS family permease